MLKPASLFGSGAVLCRRKEIRLFGEADSGAVVRAILTAADGRLLAAGEAVAEKGSFLLFLKPQEARNGCTLRFESNGETVIADDILIGDVYLAGGQSNMEMSLWNADEGQGLIPVHDAPEVRYYNVPQRAYLCEEQKKAVEGARWVAIAPGTAADMSAVAYFFAMKAHEDRQVPVGIIDCYWGGTSVTGWLDETALCRTTEGKRYLTEYQERCAGKSMDTFLREEKEWKTVFDAWNDQVAKFKEEHPGCEWDAVVKACGECPWYPPVGPGSPYRPAGLADSMLKKVAPAALTGLLYYQGEADADTTDCYEILLESMILFWREQFMDEDLPFLNVQLPMWLEAGKEDTFRWPVIRMAQAKVRDRVRNSGMICLMDQGEFNNIHPTAKRVVGERLWQLARNVVYGEPAELSPRAVSKYTEGKELTILLSGVVTEHREGKALLEIGDVNGNYVPARYVIDGNRLILTGIDRPAHARYGWTDFAQTRFFGSNGLPLEPFEL